MRNSSSSTSAWPLSSLQLSSGLPGNPEPVSNLFSRSPQTLFLPILAKGPSHQQEIHQATLGGRRLCSRPHLQSQRHHFQNLVTPSPQVQGRALERSPPLCRPHPVPVLHSPAATAASRRRCEGGAQEARRREAHLRGRAGAGRTSRAVPSMSPGGGELQQVPILHTEQRTRPSALSELKISALHTALFLFLLARRAGTLEQV